jgi:hypothetical protein
MLVALLASACSEQPAVYSAHSYSCCIEIAANTTWHAGQSVALHWQPTPPERTTDANPHLIALSVSLTGPFANVDALKQATSHDSKPAGVRTVNAAPISVNDRTVLSPISELDLPTDLPPGYYNLATRAAEASQAWGGGAVIIVVPGP